MGKKNKRHSTSDASSSKRHKTSTKEKSPPPLSLEYVTYEDMPLNHKRTYYIDDDCGRMNKYISLITWLRTLGSFDGSVFEGIANLNWCKEKNNYPLMEVEVVTPKKKSAKFLIEKSNLYVIAFYANTWFQFSKCRYIMEGFVKLDYDGSYSDDHVFEEVGPKKMIKAVHTLAKCGITETNGEMLPYVQACEIFYVHLSEAARFYPIESLVRKTLAPFNARNVAARTYEDEEEQILYATDRQSIDEKGDIYSLVKSTESVDVKFTVKTPDYIRNLIKKYNILSKCWYVYALTGKKLFEMKPDHILDLHMRSLKSVRCTLAVLCNVNLNKVLKGLKKKSGHHSTITPKMYEEIVQQVRKLQDEKKVLQGDGKEEESSSVAAVEQK